MKDKSQLVSPSVRPINMEVQEKIKLERKRHRNRIAASKCRKRKLECISKLEEKVETIEAENAELSAELKKLKEQVFQLKEEVLGHVNFGCFENIIPIHANCTSTLPTKNLNGNEILFEYLQNDDGHTNDFKIENFNSYFNENVKNSNNKHLVDQTSGRINGSYTNNLDDCFSIEEIKDKFQPESSNHKFNENSRKKPTKVENRLISSGISVMSDLNLPPYI